jgi:hypothetical protein
MRITLNDLMQSRVPSNLGICSTDKRLVAWANEAQERLLYEGKWWGTVARFSICTTKGCLTLPREIAVVEAVNVCGNPVPVRDFWYQFLANGPGSWQQFNGIWNDGTWSGCANGGLLQKENRPTFGEIGMTPSQISFACDVSTDVGKKVLVLGYDLNNNWIRTIQNGAYADGEMIALAQGGGSTSVTFFSNVTDIQFQSPMDGQSWLYVIDTSLSPTSGSVQHGFGSPIVNGIPPINGTIYINDTDATIWAVANGVWHQEV